MIQAISQIFFTIPGDNDDGDKGRGLHCYAAIILFSTSEKISLLYYYMAVAKSGGSVFCTRKGRIFNVFLCSFRDFHAIRVPKGFFVNGLCYNHV
jgi:hypothetical protein